MSRSFHQWYLDTFRPDPDEIKSSKFIRCVKCLAGDVYPDEGEIGVLHHWVFLCVSRVPFNRDELTLASSQKGCEEISCVHSGRVYVPGGGRLPWFFWEYDVAFPFENAPFSVQWGNAVLEVSSEDITRLLNSRWGETCNALIDWVAYEKWYEAHHRENLGRPTPDHGPLMSIVTPAYKTPPAFLKELIDSVVAQTYQNWEYVIVNSTPDDAGMRAVLESYSDSRIKIVELEKNLGIVGNSNAGIAASTGDYVSFLDHDDFLEPNALAEMVVAILESKRPVDLIYCDEDSVDEEYRYSKPLFKPDYNPDLMYAYNYMLHLLTVSRYVLDHTERYGDEMEGSQDYDMLLKAMEVARSVKHIPRVLYHWRTHSGSCNSNPEQKRYVEDSSLLALNNHFARMGIDAFSDRGDVMFAYRTQFFLDGERNQSCEEKVFTTKPGVYAVCADGSLKRLGSARSVNAEGLHKIARGCDEIALLVSTVKATISQRAVVELLGYFLRDEVFACAPCMVRNDRLYDYAGMMMNPRGELLRMGRWLPEEDRGYIGRLRSSADQFVLNPEFCFYRTSELAKGTIDGFYKTPEYFFADLFAQKWDMGLLNVYCPYATARLEDSRSMISFTGQNVCEEDVGRFMSKWSRLMDSGIDPTSNPNFDQGCPYYRIVPIEDEA